MRYLSFGDFLSPCLGTLGDSWQNNTFPLGSPNEVSLFLLSFYLFFLFPLTINHRSEGRRKEITAMFLVLVPAGLGGCYFRLNQLHAGSLDEMPPHGNLLEMSPGGGFHQCDLGPEKLQLLRSPQAPQLKPGWEPNFFQGTPLGKMAPLPDSAGKNASSVLRKQLHPRCEDQTLLRVSGFTSLTAEFKKSVKSGLSSLWPKEGERNAARTHVGLEMTAWQAVSSAVRDHAAAGSQGSSRPGLAGRGQDTGPAFQAQQQLRKLSAGHKATQT